MCCSTLQYHCLDSFCEFDHAVQEWYRPVDSFQEGHNLELWAGEHNNEALSNGLSGERCAPPLVSGGYQPHARALRLIT